MNAQTNTDVHFAYISANPTAKPADSEEVARQRVVTRAVWIGVAAIVAGECLFKLVELAINLF